MAPRQIPISNRGPAIVFSQIPSLGILFSPPISPHSNGGKCFQDFDRKLMQPGRRLHTHFYCHYVFRTVSVTSAVYSETATATAIVYRYIAILTGIVYFRHCLFQSLLLGFQKPPFTVSAIVYSDTAIYCHGYCVSRHCGLRPMLSCLQTLPF